MQSSAASDIEKTPLDGPFRSAGGVLVSDDAEGAKKRKKTVDAVAASLILEGYLNSRRR